MREVPRASPPGDLAAPGNPRNLRGTEMELAEKKDRSSIISAQLARK